MDYLHRTFGDAEIYAVFARYGYSPDPSALRAHVARHLPEYMVPAVVVVLDGPLPLTPNGKLDRRALPAPDWSALAGSRRPETSVQRVLTGLFAEVLALGEVGVAEVGLDKGFFDLGGHSMAVMRLLGRVRAELGADLSVRDVFDAPTVAELAAVLDGAGAGPGDRPALTRGPQDVEGPLAPSQRWRWQRHLAAASGPVGSRADHALVLWPQGPLDPDALAAAPADVAARHEPLRTLFTTDPAAAGDREVGTDRVTGGPDRYRNLDQHRGGWSPTPPRRCAGRRRPTCRPGCASWPPRPPT